MCQYFKTVEIVFSGSNEISKTIDAINRDFDKIGGSITNVTGPLDKITDKLLGAEAAFAALAIAGMGYAIKSAAEFEESFDKVALRITASTGAIEIFREDVLRYGSDSSRSLGDINAALTESIQKGTNYKDAIAQLATAEHLAVATHSDLKSSTVLLSTVMNAYGASVSEATHYGDIFTQGVKMGAGEIPQLADEMGKIAGIAHGMGIPLETRVAAISALGSYGVDTGAALGGLKFMLNNLLDPSKEAREAASRLGISFSAAAVQTQGLETVMRSAYAATNGNAEAMKTLFGSVRGLNVAFDLAGDSQGHFRDNLLATRDATGVMQKEYDNFVNDFGNVNQRLENSFKTTFIEIGTKLMPQYANIATALSDLMKGIKIGIDSGAFDPLFNALDEYGRKIAETLRIIAKNLPEALEGIDFSGLLKSLEGLGGSVGAAFKAIFGHIDLETPEGLHQVIQRIVDGLAALTNITKGVIDGMEPLFKLIGEGIDQFSKLDESSAGLIGNVLGVAKSINILAEYSGTLTAVLSILTGKALIDTSMAILSLGEASFKIIPGIVTLVSSLSLAEFGALGVSAAFGVAVGSLISHNEAVTKASQALLGLVDVNKDFFGAQGRTKAQMDEVNKNFDAAVLKHKQLTSGTGETTDATVLLNKATKEIDLSNAQKAFDDLNATLKKTRDDLEAAKLPERWDMSIVVTADGGSIETTKDMIYTQLGDNSSGEREGMYILTNIGTVADEARLAATKKKIDDAIPPLKLLEIQATLDVAKIKSASDVIQHSIEFKAKIDIAQIEAETARLKTMFDSINTSITSTGTALVSEIGSYATVLSAGKGGTGFIEQQIVEESRRRDAAFALQSSLITAQVEVLKKQATALEKGEGIIKIEGTGLAPHLEAFMYEILKAIQVKANAEGMKFLVGV